MKKLLATIALGATIVSTQTFAQDDRGQMGDMTRQEAQQRADAMFQRFDVNHDGVVTRQEAEQVRSQMGFGSKRAEKMINRAFGSAQSLTLQQFEAESLAQFDAMDLNHDGVVTAAERQQARAMMRAQRAGQGQPPGQ